MDTATNTVKSVGMDPAQTALKRVVQKAAVQMRFNWKWK